MLLVDLVVLSHRDVIPRTGGIIFLVRTDTTPSHVLLPLQSYSVICSQTLPVLLFMRHRLSHLVAMWNVLEFLGVF